MGENMCVGYQSYRSRKFAALCPTFETYKNVVRMRRASIHVHVNTIERAEGLRG